MVILGIRMRIMCLTPSMQVENFEMAKYEDKCGRDVSIHGSASEVHRSGTADLQVVSRHHYLVVFCRVVDRLSYLWTHSGVNFCPPPSLAIASWAARAKK